LKPGVANRKATKADVSRALHIHVDVDDAGGLDRIRKSLPKPTAVVFSGGGYQAFWKLREPSTALTRVERVNLEIARGLGGDNCHNIDRIMRLPGTINVPNAKKRNAGRVPTLAYVIEAETDWPRLYTLDDFDDPTPGAPAQLAPTASGAIGPMGFEQLLPIVVSDALRTLIELGDDVDRLMGTAQARFPSRSEAVWSVACELAHAGCAVEQIAGVLLNPAYGISASILEKRKPITFSTYKFQSRHVVGPLAPSEARRAIIRSGVGARAKARDIELLGRVKVHGLTTRQIRAWHKLLSEEVSVYSANKALMILKAPLALAAEDHEFRPPAMPTGLQRRPETERKAVLTPDEVAKLLAAARGDHDNDIYAAFPFLAGTRPSEQLGLLWDDVDFEANVVRIGRIQLRDGSLSDFTKTAAGVRSIPMSPLLRGMLLAWRVRCPRKDGELHRVFPALGNLRAWPLPRANGGGPLIYGNFRTRIWAPVLNWLGLPQVTPHSARHSFISVLQAQGIEVGLVAKLAGHKNAVVTLSHYTHAMRGGEDAVRALDRAYAASAP
jgi:integrase